MGEAVLAGLTTVDTLSEGVKFGVELVNERPFIGVAPEPLSKGSTIGGIFSMEGVIAVWLAVSTPFP